MEPRTFIIAEAGVNHNGDVKLAKKLIDAAVEAGADAVKFQTFKTEAVISKCTPKAAYQLNITDENESQFEMVKKLELSEDEHRELLDYCKEKSIMFLSTPFDLGSVDFLCELGLEIFKIPSGEITNLPYLRKVGSLGKRIVLSTGMSTMQEVQAAIEVIEKSGTKKADITVLHCNTEYPTPAQDANIRAMLAMKDEFGVDVGYSDHTEGIEASIAAVALGAKVIEKHFTLDKNMEGPDHKASLEPGELKCMVKAIRNIEKMLGDGIKKVTQSEKHNRDIARKSIVAAKDIRCGDVFSEENITIKRPATGINPMKWDDVIGKKSERDFAEDELIEMG